MASRIKTEPGTSVWCVWLSFNHLSTIDDDSSYEGEEGIAYRRGDNPRH
jgi:hypothetical protein